MTDRARWEALPEELRWTAQWLVAGPDNNGQLKAPYYPHNGKLIKASPTNPEHWMDFETACMWAEAYRTHIGFVLHKDDPFGCVDLDVKNQFNEPDPEKWTSQANIDRYWSIVQVMDSYTERSRSGQGLHIWVRANIGDGRKRDGVELYTQSRFMVCTGDVILDKPVSDRQALMENMAAQMPTGGSQIELVELEATESDEEIIDRAVNAGNADKFNQLCAMTAGPAGTWHGNYPSQSEADLALMSIFTFYSKSNEQCKRLFRMAPLSHREKATRDDVYLNRTLKLIRSRQAREEVMNDSSRAMAADLVRELQQKAMAAQQAEQAPAPQAAPYAVDPATGECAAPVTTAAPLEAGLPWPPGFIGALAQHIYNSSPRPVKEVSIVSALGFMAGVCGKAYVIPGSGLNVYIILVARSAVGKEAMHSGIGSILGELRESVPVIHRFVDFADFASGPALVKSCSANPSFVNVAGEWGKKLERLSKEDGRDAAMQSLRTVMTNLYQKSGPMAVVGGLTYSNKEQNVASVNGVAFSMIGESTPGTFYDALTNRMMEDGFLSRFTVIAYDGDRPPLNKNTVTRMDQRLRDAVAGIVVHACSTLDKGAGASIGVTFDPHAQQMLDEFNLQCDAEINSTDDESWRQMWNRAHLKALRIAALLAVGDNHLVPTVFPIHAQWALELIKKDIQIFKLRMQSGDIGSGDNVREAKMLSVLREYLTEQPAEGYKIPDAMWRGGVVPRKYLQIRCARVSAFTEHRLGSNAALDQSIRSLTDSGYLVEVDKGKLVAEYGFHGKCFRVVNLPELVVQRKRKSALQ